MTPSAEAQWFNEFSTQMRDVLAETRQMRTEIAAQFAALEQKYVLQQVWSTNLQNLHERQDRMQTAGDAAIIGVDTELQQVRRLLVDLDDKVEANHRAALQEIRDAEVRRQAELVKVADQRHSDRVAYTIAFLALAGGLLAALLPGWMS